jgi:hypothetical protein
MKRIFVIALLLVGINTNAQETSSKVKIFYDCQTSCYQTFMKQNLPEVEFVRDRNFADAHIMITSETNGSGGQTFHLEFFGQNDYKAIQEKYSFATNTDMTTEQKRKMMLKYLKLGLLKFWVKNGLVDKLDLNIKSEKTKKEQKDPWNKWVFRISANGWFNGSSNSSSSNINTSISAKQTKENHKYYFSMNYGRSDNMYKFGEQKIFSKTEWLSASASDILSINEHWSYGFFTGISQSLYSNYKISTYLKTGLEYDIFPYKVSSTKSIVFGAKLGANYYKYYEKTVYNKLNEFLWKADLSISGSVVKKWGSLNLTTYYSTYLHNAKLNSFGFNAGTNIRIVKGLNFRINGAYSVTHNKINIAGGDLSLEETLLQQKELQSGYNYYASVGLSYSFGSIYNTIVNPRFTSGGGGRTYYF